MKARVGQRATVADQAASSSRAKTETLSANGAAGQQTTAQARKRRSSINVYDQPSSLNSRLRQLETDMLRLDEDRNRLVDETHASLAQYELKLSEIHAIIKSRQDNVERYVEDMRMLLQAKEDFEKQAKSLTEKHDRIHEKFMHRETIISREIKLLKNKFEALEKNRQFRGMLQKSTLSGDTPANDDLNSGLDGSADGLGRKRSETGTTLTASELDSLGAGGGGALGVGGALGGGVGGGGGGGLGEDKRQAGASSGGGGRKNVRIKMSNLGALSQILEPLFRFTSRRKRGLTRRARRKSNRVSSILGASDNATDELAPLSATTTTSNHLDSANAILADTGDAMVNGATTVVAADGVCGGEPGGKLVNSSSTTAAAAAAKIKTTKPSSFMGRFFRAPKRR